MSDGHGDDPAASNWRAVGGNLPPGPRTLPLLLPCLSPVAPLPPDRPSKPRDAFGSIPIPPSPPILARGLGWCGALRPVSPASTALHHVPRPCLRLCGPKLLDAFETRPPGRPWALVLSKGRQIVRDRGPVAKKRQACSLAVSRLRAPSRYKRRYRLAGCELGIWSSV